MRVRLPVTSKSSPKRTTIIVRISLLVYLKANWLVGDGGGSPSNHLEMCVYTHCVSAPAPPANSNLVAIYNNSVYNFTHTEVEIGSPVLYMCANGMRGDPDWNHINTSALCGKENVWTPSDPSWPTCTDSELFQKVFAVLLLPIRAQHLSPSEMVLWSP